MFPILCQTLVKSVQIYYFVLFKKNSSLNFQLVKLDFKIIVKALRSKL